MNNLFYSFFITIRFRFLTCCVLVVGSFLSISSSNCNSPAQEAFIILFCNQYFPWSSAANTVFSLKSYRWNRVFLLSLSWYYKLLLQRTILNLSVQFDRVWQELPVLVIVSMLAYFCFLEQLLVRIEVLSHDSALSKLYIIV